MVTMHDVTTNTSPTNRVRVLVIDDGGTAYATAATLNKLGYDVEIQSEPVAYIKAPTYDDCRAYMDKVKDWEVNDVRSGWKHKRKNKKH
jgi:hypothetical protein